MTTFQHLSTHTEHIEVETDSGLCSLAYVAMKWTANSFFLLSVRKKRIIIYLR